MDYLIYIKIVFFLLSWICKRICVESITKYKRRLSVTHFRTVIQYNLFRTFSLWKLIPFKDNWRHFCQVHRVKFPNSSFAVRVCDFGVYHLFRENIYFNEWKFCINLLFTQSKLLFSSTSFKICMDLLSFFLTAKQDLKFN